MNDWQGFEDLEEFGDAEHNVRRLNPIHFRSWWASNYEFRLSDHHDAAQYYTLIRSRNRSHLDGFRSDFHAAATTEYSKLVFELGKLFVRGYGMKNAKESREQLLEIYGLQNAASQSDKLNSGDRAEVLSGEAAQKAVEAIIGPRPGFVKIHSASDLNGKKFGDSRVDHRDKMRVELEKEKQLVSLKNSDEVDAAISAIHECTPWMKDVTIWLWAQLRDSLEAQRGSSFRPPLLVGPPGCGKTYLAEFIAETLKRPWVRLEGSTMTASFPVGGCDYAWSSGHPSEAVRLIAQSGIANPVVIFDELEKTVSTSSGGDPKNALLPLLQSSSAATYQCPYLQSKIDLSHVSWILLANSLDKLPAPLLDRVTVFHVGYPTGADLRKTVERALAEYAVDYAVINKVVDEIENGGMTLRAIDRVKSRLRDVMRRPVIH